MHWRRRSARPPPSRLACSGYTAATGRRCRALHSLLNAATKGVEGGLVTIENFDETLRDLIRLLNGLNTEALEAFAGEREDLVRRRLGPAATAAASLSFASTASS